MSRARRSGPSSSPRPSVGGRARRPWPAVAAGLLVAVVLACGALAGVLGDRLASASADAGHQVAQRGTVPPRGSENGGVDAAPPASDAPAPSVAPPDAEQPPGAGTTADGLTAADGVVPDGASVFDDSLPAVTRLDPDLLTAVRRAARDAARSGLAVELNSGWRSPAYQDVLLQDAVERYGSAQEAARWVATAETSPHVHGDAVDLGPTDVAAWLADHGAAYGLCQVYDNEPWHLELRPRAVTDGCPARYADPTQDPRMQG